MAFLSPYTPTHMNHNILFICTGNYYRSRFSEILFNHLSVQNHSQMSSFSRGLKLWSGNKGPLSPHTKSYMEQKQIGLDNHMRMPISLTLQDLKSASRIIAMDKTEHKVLMLDQFPDWAEKIEYWQFEDDYIKAPEEVLPALEKQVVKLVEELKLEYIHQDQN